MTGEAPDNSHPLQRWIGETFGTTPPRLPGAEHTVLEEQIFVVLQVATRYGTVPWNTLDRLARAAAIIINTSEPDRVRPQLQDLLGTMPMRGDHFTYVIDVIAHLPDTT